MRRSAILSLACLAALFVGPLASSAVACPMCKASVEEEDRRPQAYMYSIIFMLSVPATIMSGLGVGLYKINRADNAVAKELEEQ